MTSTTPRYKAIEDFLLERIHGGVYPVNHQIPPEEQLARDFDVSRMTANKAINNLVQKGYLVRQAGLGTFVTDRKAESSLHEVLNIAAEVRGRGHAYSNDVLRCEAVEADDEVALRLGLRLGAQVFHSILVHREDGVPIQLEDRFVNPAIAPDYLEQEFSHTTPNAFLTSIAPIAKTEQFIEAVLPQPWECKVLAIARSEPCILIRRRTWSQDRVVTTVRLLYPGSRYRLQSNF